MNVSNLPNEARTARPADHPPAASGRVGVLIVNLGTPEGTDYWSIRRYLQEFLSDRRVIETPRVIWAPILQAILLRRPHAKGRDYEFDLEQGAGRGAAENDHACAKRKARARAPQSRQGRRRRLGHALWRAADRGATQGASGRGLRPHSRHSPLSAILRRFDGDGRRQNVRSAAVHALAAGGSCRRALLRRSRLYRGARPLRPRQPRRSRLRTRNPGRLLSRHSASLFRQGRSLFLPLREDDAALARSDGHGARSAC